MRLLKWSPLLLLLLASGMASAQAYRLTDLGTLGGASSAATGINDFGQVVGYSATSGDAGSHATLWGGGAATDLGTLGGAGSRAYGINNAGQIVGVADGAGDGRAALWNGASARQLAAGPQELAGGAGGVAYAINNAGQIAGASVYGGATHATVWNGGVRADLGTTGGAFSEAYGINNRGQVSGISNISMEDDKYNRTGVVWDAGSGTAVNSLHAAYGINDSGTLTGLQSGLYAPPAIWSAGTTTALGSIDTYGIAYDVNNSGLAVGFLLATDQPYHAMLWRGNQMVDLNTLYGAADAGFAYLSIASAVNEHGQIVGTGVTYDGTEHAFLLSPVPEPSAWWLLALGLSVVLGLARRGRRRSV